MKKYFKNRIQNLQHLISAVLESDEVKISDLIEIKRQCDNMSGTISSLCYDIFVDIDQ